MGEKVLPQLPLLKTPLFVRYTNPDNGKTCGKGSLNLHGGKGSLSFPDDRTVIFSTPERDWNIRFFTLSEQDHWINCFSNQDFVPYHNVTIFLECFDI